MDLQNYMNGAIRRIMSKAYLNVLGNPREAKTILRLQNTFLKSEKRRFLRIVDRYSARIAALPQKTSFWQTFPLRGWILIVCMSALGVALKSIPGIPVGDGVVSGEALVVDGALLGKVSF
ncbi:MAG: hypothetical protein SPK76_01910 [Bacteroidales bacterium]|nr:hypothetical protein [Bacteroidales bacterium]MDY6443766.1 hypothetical protein [Bacteroidales bacterium]